MTLPQTMREAVNNGHGDLDQMVLNSDWLCDWLDLVICPKRRRWGRIVMRAPMLNRRTDMAEVSNFLSGRGA